MAARPRRYEYKAEFWTTLEQMRGLELLCSDGLSDKATHLRRALQAYLHQFGIDAIPPRPAAANGKQQEHGHVL